MARKGRPDPKAELERLTDTSAQRENAMVEARKQVQNLARLGVGAVIVIWLLAVGFWSGLESTIPLFVAAALTVAVAVVAFLVRRNLGRSEELGALMGDGSLDEEERARRVAKLEARVEKGEHAAILARAQLEMQDDPRAALATLEQADLDKGQKMVINQIRGMRGMLHLNFGELKAARELAEAIELEKTPDLAARANLAGVVAEAWARSGNPIEADELLDKYDAADPKFSDVRVQLLRARAFVGAHRNDLAKMRKALKALEEMSAQLLAAFVGGKRVHPLLVKEARKRLERSGAIPKPRVKMVTR
ncbi:MAG: hypothetical protein AAFU79_27255 [Myxococcota bacterium]